MFAYNDVQNFPGAPSWVWMVVPSFVRLVTAQRGKQSRLYPQWQGHTQWPYLLAPTGHVIGFHGYRNGVPLSNGRIGLSIAIMSNYDSPSCLPFCSSEPWLHLSMILHRPNQSRPRNPDALSANTSNHQLMPIQSILSPAPATLTSDAS